MRALGTLARSLRPYRHARPPARLHRGPARRDGRLATGGPRCCSGCLTFAVLLVCLRAARRKAALAGAHLRPGRDALRDLRLADLGRLPLPLRQHPALRPARARTRVRVRDHRRGPAARAPARRRLPLGRPRRGDRVGLRRRDPASAHRTPGRPGRPRALAAARVVHAPLAALDDVRRDLDRDGDARDRGHPRRRLGVGADTRPGAAWRWATRRRPSRRAMP